MKLLEPIKVGNIEFKNRIMFPPLTTGYEEKDGSIGEQSFRFYERLAKGGVGYIVIGDVAPLSTFSPTPKLYSPQQAEGLQRPHRHRQRHQVQKQCTDQPDPDHSRSGMQPVQRQRKQ